MKGKKIVARVCAFLVFVAAVISFLMLTLPSAWVKNVPLISTLNVYMEALLPFTQFSFIPEPYQQFVIPALLLTSSLLLLLFQRSWRFWWMIPDLFIIYYTVFTYLRLKGGFNTPGPVIGLLSTNAFFGHILVLLALILEGVISLLFLYLSLRFFPVNPAGGGNKNTKSAVEERRIRKPAENRRTEVREEPLRSDKRKRRKLKDEATADPQSEGQKAAPPESPGADTAVQAPAREKGPLSFPSLKDVPELPSVGVTKKNSVYVGRLNEMKDASLVLTDIPLEEHEPAEGESENPAEEKKAPFKALFAHLEKDRMTKDLTVPKAVPSREHPLRRREEKPQAVVDVSPVEDVPVKPVDPPQVTREEVQDVPDEVPAASDDDIDFVSGVGGLMRDPGSALLSRGKIGYTHPSPELLDSYPNHASVVDDETIAAGERLMDTLKEFKIDAKVAHIIKGPTVTMYEVTLAPGVRVSSIINLGDNIAMELAAQRVRIVAPIPGKQAVGIEVPNKRRSIIGFRDLLDSVEAHKLPHLPMILGRKITGEPVVVDIARTPHLLIAGQTGSGKSVCVNSLINSLLYLKSPKEVRLILVDPKIVELRIYNGIPHLLTPVITEPKKTIKALEFCLYEMDRRYKMLNSLSVRNISAYNTKVDSQRIAREKLPYIVVIIDEFADIMTTVGKELETNLARLAAMARAVGIHLVLATQRPSSDVITGTIKSNIPSRIAFTVSGQVNSRIIIDENGAEKLLGQGDMLLAPGWEPNSTRIQGAFLSDDEVERVVDYVKTQGEPDYLDEAFFEDEVESADEGDDDIDDDSDEALREKSIRIIIERNGASASYLQRRLRIGYNKAARIIELLEEEGIVGPARGSKPRELLRMPD